jgi:Na+/proline symporter
VHLKIAKTDEEKRKQKEYRMNEQSESLKRATVKGALVWGSVYTTATAGSAYVLVPTFTDSVIALSEILKHSLMVFPFAGALRGAIMWRAKNGYNAFRGGRRK